jgi:hypothetical protein
MFGKNLPFLFINYFKSVVVQPKKSNLEFALGSVLASPFLMSGLGF